MLILVTALVVAPISFALGWWLRRTHIQYQRRRWEDEMLAAYDRAQAEAGLAPPRRRH